MTQKIPSLVLVDEKILLKNLPLKENEYIIGRSDDCDFVLCGNDVSRRHARIYYQDKNFFIEDLDSTNGTYVNGKKVKRIALRHGDEIKIGNFTIMFDDGSGIGGIYEETQTCLQGNETQRLVAQYKLLTQKIRERDIARELRLYHEKVIKDRRKLKHQANFDRLTGLFNRRYFDKIIKEKFVSSQKTHQPLSLLYIDIDHFKRVNDTLGHDKGDEVLRVVAHLIRSLCRKDDIVVRYGGEEFVILFPRMPLESAVEVAEFMRRTIEEKTPEILGLKVTVSIGVATHSQGKMDIQKFIKIADNALYQAKSCGRNCVVKGNE